jgi:hypothetical protein
MHGAANLENKNQKTYPRDGIREISIVTFIVSCEWILLELQSFEFFEPKNSAAKGMRPRIVTVGSCSSCIFPNLCFASY